MSNEELDTINHREIIELANIIAERPCDSVDCAPCIRMGRRCNDYLKAERAIKAGYRKQSEGEWVLEHETRGKMVCSNCREEASTKTVVDRDCTRHILYDKKPFCHKCGAKMKGV